MEFSEKLKTLRRERGISQAALAAQIHISRSAVAKWENGLGLPGEESLQLLADYFGIETSRLLPSKDSEEKLVSKNRTIAAQGKVITAFAVGCGLGLVLLAYLFIEPLRDNLPMAIIGIITIVLGAHNINGNIASIHWYNRRKVKKEDQLPYCRAVGSGTITIGAAMAAAAIVQSTPGDTGPLIGGGINLLGITVGLAIILYAQIKYNKGIF